MKTSFFSCKNLYGDYPALSEEVRLGTPTAVFGLSDTHKFLTAAVVSPKILYVTADAVSARKAQAALTVLTGKKCALISAKDEAVLYKDALSKDALYKRICALAEISAGADCAVAEAEALMQLVPARVEVLKLEKGKDYDYSGLPQKLVSMGYTREYSADSRGSFAIRGDILDIYPINSENPARVDFFGDTVEKIRPYEPVGGERLEECDVLEIVSAVDAPFTADDLTRVRQALTDGVRTMPDVKAYGRARAIADEVCEKMSLGIPFSGVSFVMPLLENSRDVFAYLPQDTLIVFDECKQISDRMEGVYREHKERVSDLKKGGEAFDFSLNQLLSPEEMAERFAKFRCMAVQTFTSGTAFFRPLKTFTLKSTPAPSYLNSLPQFFSDAKSWLQNGYRILAFTGSVERSQRLSGMIEDEYLPSYPVPDRLEALRGIAASSEELERGLILHECKLVIIGSADLFTKAAVKRVRRRRGDMFVAPEIGDFCVHEKHGIGKITGTQRIETTDGIKEYVAVQYKGGDVLYVPVEQMDVLSKYVGDGDPPLSKIGGADFERVKERVRQSIRKLAFDLKELYAERQAKKGFAFPENAVMMQEFEDSFKYEETPDQLISIEEIKKDMCSEKVMDRLLCGDVGYGKTEVALRAVYLAVLGGKQAAIMCPSTVLSEQHYNTAVERFSEFGVRVDKLNRFKTPAQQAETLKALANGDIDLIIGTHRLLSDDVKFYDLGLLVLDEEQRFGVEHKEKIKHVKKDVDCLTMTATPIPRTLHMSLAGIRDISTINTPPQKRLPVQTYVVEESETLIRDAVIREISRGGQVFILYNRVDSIAAFTERIKAIVPEARTTFAHGRMDRDSLENSVFSFYRGEYNVLVTTTIIENGIDLPNANTLIVIDSDRLGISQLYQLRGRVGRSSRLAQAYFTFKGEKVLTSDATERLKAIMKFTELGSGFKIAMRDLEIRGAGNVLGAEQHGHMDKVGYELYSKLLKEELTGEAQLSAELEIKTTAYIPENYIESSAGRLDCYKRIAEIRSIDDYKRVCRSVEDNYGPLPDEVLNLLVIAVLKAYAQKFNVKRITVSRQESFLELPSVNSLNDARLSSALEKYKSIITLSMARAPLVVFKNDGSPRKIMLNMTKFLKFALQGV